MKVNTPYPLLRYPVVRAKHRKGFGGEVEGVTPPLRIEFSRKGVWDSDAPGVLHMYREYVEFFSTDKEPLTVAEVKEHVENYLRGHPERGVMFHIEDEPTGDVRAPAPQQAIPENVNICTATITGAPGEESRICGKPVAEDEDLCADCMKVANKVTETV